MHTCTWASIHVCITGGSVIVCDVWNGQDTKEKAITFVHFLSHPPAVYSSSSFSGPNLIAVSRYSGAGYTEWSKGKISTCKGRTILKLVSNFPWLLHINDPKDWKQLKNLYNQEHRNYDTNVIIYLLHFSLMFYNLRRNRFWIMLLIFFELFQLPLGKNIYTWSMWGNLEISLSLSLLCTHWFFLCFPLIWADRYKTARVRRIRLSLDLALFPSLWPLAH